MKHIEAVIFDWAGTTVDFGSTSPVSAFTEAFRRAGVAVTGDEVRAPMGLLKRDHIRTMLAMPRIAQLWHEVHGRAPDQSDVERVYADFEPALFAVLPRHCDIKPGVLETMDFLRANGIRIGSTTGFTSAMMAVVAPKAKDGGYAPDSMVTADEVCGFGRPWPYMVFENMRRLGLGDVRKVVKVGDTVSDMAEAKNAGCIAVGVLEGSSMIGLDRISWDRLSQAQKAEKREAAREAFYAAGADFVILDMGELPKLLSDIELMRRAQAN